MSYTTHHLYSPSSLARRELCPASARLEKDLPGFDTEDGTEGTRLHAEIAKTITEAITTDDDIEVEDENVDKMFKKFMEIAGCGTVADFSELSKKIHFDYTMDVFVEKHLEYKYCGIVQFSGTADVLIVTDDKVIVIDWKTGHRFVEDAENNDQTAAYALAAMQTFGKEKADVYIYNPVIGQDQQTVFTDKASIAQYIIGIISKCEEPDAPICPGEEQCRYCRAAYHGTCPALAKTTELTAQKAEEIVPLPALSVLAADDLCEYKRKCDLIAKFAERIDAELKRRIEKDGSCGGWILKESSGGREITDINRAFQESGLPADLFLKACTCSITKLEKEFIKFKDDAYKTQKDAKSALASLLEEVIQDKPKKKSLVLAK